MGNGHGYCNYIQNVITDRTREIKRKKEGTRKRRERGKDRKKERKRDRKEDLTHDPQSISIEGELIDLFLGISQEGVKGKKERKEGKIERKEERERKKEKERGKQGKRERGKDRKRERKRDRRRDLTHDPQLTSIEGKLINLFLGISQEGVKGKKERKE